MLRRPLLAATLLLGGLPPRAAQAQLVLTSASAKTENFDGLGTSATAAVPPGFALASGATGISYASAANTTATTRAAGTSGTGALTATSAGGTYNFAPGITASATDRALGFLASGSYAVPRHLLLAVQNNTGATITDLALSYDVEKYRAGTATGTEWQLWTSPDGSTWTQLTGLTQAYAADAATAVVNPPTTTRSTTLSGLNLAAGATTYLRWTYTAGASTNAQGLGLDNLVLTPTLGTATTPAASISTAAGTYASPYCVTSSQGSAAFPVAFTSTGVAAGSTFTAQLSDASGSFASPTVVGSGTSSPLSAAVPAGTASGTAYRLRVVSGATIGADNGSNLTVNLAPATNPVTVSPGAAQTLATNASGASLMAAASVASTYAWFYGTSQGGPYATAISGATTSTYQPKGSDFAGGAGTYYLVAQATSSCGGGGAPAPR